MSTLTHILHVDDEPDIQTVTALALEALGGYTVISCGSGAEALQKVEQFTPDLVILDVMMPTMDGPATLIELRKHASMAMVPVIFMTAKVQAQEIEHYLSLGACGVITKPFDPEALCGDVEKLWQQSQN